MLKKKYNLQKQIFLKHNYRRLFLEKLFNLSLSSNQLLEPSERLSFFSRDSYCNDLYHK